MHTVHGLGGLVWTTQVRNPAELRLSCSVCINGKTGKGARKVESHVRQFRALQSKGASRSCSMKHIVI